MLLLLLCDRLSGEGCHPAPPLLPRLPGLAGHRSTRGLSMPFLRRCRFPAGNGSCPAAAAAPSRCTPVPVAQPCRDVCQPLGRTRPPPLQCSPGCRSKPPPPPPRPWGPWERRAAPAASTLPFSRPAPLPSVSRTRLQMSGCVDLSDVFVCGAGDLLLVDRCLACCNFKGRE